MKIFAHRGFSGKYPENTMLAFEKAAQAGAFGIELDVHHSSDGKLVIIHDEALKRTTGKEGTVSSYTLSDLVKINAGNSFGFTPIPSFEEYCSFICKTDLVTNIEIKTNQVYYSGIEADVLAMIRKYKMEEKVIISSFNWLSVVNMKKLDKSIACGLLHEGCAMENIGALARMNAIEYYHPSYQLLNDRIVQNCRENGVLLNVWTINSKKQFDQLVKWDANAAITNYPDLESMPL